MTTYFISGHGDLTHEEFTEHYVPEIDEAIEEGANFVLGDFEGADTMAARYLHSKGLRHKVRLYHMFSRPRHFVGSFPTVGGFTTDELRDAAMTEVSDEDIAWLREGKEESGTAKNLARRKEGDIQWDMNTPINPFL